MVDRSPRPVPPPDGGSASGRAQGAVDPRAANGHRVTNGKRVDASAIAFTEPIKRKQPAELPPVEPEFWFGPPLPEESLPPLPDEPVNGVHKPIARRLEADDPVATHVTERLHRRHSPVDDAGPTEILPKVEPTPAAPARRVVPQADPEPAPPVVPQADPKAAPVVPQPARKPADPPAQAKADVDEPAEPETTRRRAGRHRRPPRKQPLWREVLVLLGVAVLLTFFIQHFIGRVYSIPSGSMEQTLHGCPGCTGDRVFVDKIVYEFRDPEPGDVVVFHGPNTWTENDVRGQRSDNPIMRGVQYVGSLVGIAPPDGRDFVKRVIAVGGQTVECCDEQNRVVVNGKPLDEPYIHWENGGPSEHQRFDRVTVPEGTLWVMGDNRLNSSDSRYQGGGGIRGVVPLGKVIGKARYIVLPPSRWRGVGDHNPQQAANIAAASWQQGLPAGLGLAAAWPVLWLGRRAKNALITRKAD